MASTSTSGGSAFDPIIPLASASVASSSGTKPLPYDVFINHCGQDVKHTLASSIYKSLDATGLRVFLDKDELNHGDFFPRAIEEAISSASLHIAIFSQHYAESPWCLAELAFMVKTRTLILPIFYYVEPSDLRLVVAGKRKYADAFSEHLKKGRYSPEELQRWKQALHEVSFCHGEIVQNMEDEQRVVKNVVNRVLKKMNKVPIKVAKHPVGLDKTEQDFDMIALQSAGPIQIVGICGMGGSGKTTLAKEIFNNRCLAFDRSSFLFGIRDATGKGLLVEKQKKLLEDLNVKGESFDNVDVGKGILKSRLRSVSVLIILDDVDHTDQLDALLPAREMLGHGSLIVVTTRELDVLKTWGISAIYQMKPLNATHAKQLFCWHAFLQPSPLSGFEDLVEEFLKVCNGLPLSLKVLGAQLYGRSRKVYWQSLLDKLSRILPDDIKLRLKVSYDALDDEEKEMFLDTACFFIGRREIAGIAVGVNPSVAIAVWDGSGWTGLHGWERLFNKCLVEVDEDGFIRMHDHLRDLGREIANGQSPYRLWSPKQTIQIHPQQEAIRIRGMANAVGDNCYPRQGKIIIHTSQGERLLAPSSLGMKIFVGNGDFFNDEHSELSRELVWLQCNKFEHKNLSSWLSLEKLRILELFDPRSLKDLWERDADAPSQLRELVIQEEHSLRGFPKSIAHLKNLTKIIIGGQHVNCHTLSSLPKEFCLLKSLEHLDLIRCTNLSSLPSRFGELTNLQHLSLNGSVKLKMLPDSIKKLTLLHNLQLMGCGELIIKPELHILENMTKLRYLNLDGCRKLEELRLPEVAPLTKLCLGGTSLKELPANILQLTELTELVIGSQLMTSLPISLGNLSSLTKLKIRGCEMLESLPPSLEHLNFLGDLDIEQSGLKCLPKSLIHLQSLQIHRTPISELSFGSGCMLKTLDLSGTKLTKISISRDCCPFLETLSLYNNMDLKELDTLPTTLKTIDVSDCDVLQDIKGLRGLKNLQKLTLYNCKELDGLPCFAEFVSLEIFTLEGCSKVKEIAGLQELRSLRELSIELDGLPSLAKLTSLKKIELKKCIKLEKIESFERLRSLEELKISDCPELEALPSLPQTTSLKTIQLEKCQKLEKVEGLKSLRSVETLYIRDCPELDGLPSLAELTSLKSFHLENCRKLEKIESLESLSSLELLAISDCPELDGLPSLAELTSLNDFRLHKCIKLDKIEGLESLRSLKWLSISDCPKLDGLPSLAELSSLSSFSLHKCNKLEKIEGLSESLRSLEFLTISDCPELDRLPSLAELTSLQNFALRECHKLKKIEGLESLRSLETLKVCDCPELNELPNLGELTSLKTFELKMCRKLEKIEGLERLRSLEKLEVRTRWKAPCIVGLEQCERLKSVVVVANDRSVVEPFISNIQKWPREVIICTRAAFDVGSLRNFFELLNVSVLDYSDVVEIGSDRDEFEFWTPESSGLALRRPEGSINANAILICFIIDSVYSDLPTERGDHFKLSLNREHSLFEEPGSFYLHRKVESWTDYGGGHSGGCAFNAELGKGKWVLMGVFTQGSRMQRAGLFQLWAYRKGNKVEVKVEEAWLVMGEGGSIVEAFHQLFHRSS